MFRKCWDDQQKRSCFKSVFQIKPSTHNLCGSLWIIHDSPLKYAAVMKLIMSRSEARVVMKCEEPSFLCNHLRVKRAQNINRTARGCCHSNNLPHKAGTGLLKLKWKRPTASEKSRTRSDDDLSVFQFKLKNKKAKYWRLNGNMAWSHFSGSVLDSLTPSCDCNVQSLGVESLKMGYYFRPL